MLREVPGRLGSGSCGGCCRGWDDRSCRRVRGLETREVLLMDRGLELGAREERLEELLGSERGEKET